MGIAYGLRWQHQQPLAEVPKNFLFLAIGLLVLPVTEVHNFHPYVQHALQKCTTHLYRKSSF